MAQPKSRGWSLDNTRIVKTFLYQLMMQVFNSSFSGCSTEVEYSPRDSEDVGLNLA